MSKTCCILVETRQYSDDYLAPLERGILGEVMLALRDGYRHFLCGLTEQSDLIFARCVHSRRADYPDLRLEALLPFAGRLRQLRKKNKALLSACDSITILSDKYSRSYRFGLVRALVRRSDRVIAVAVRGVVGDTAYAIEAARLLEREVRIVELRR